MYILNLVTLSVKDLNAGKGFLFPTQQPRMAGLKGPFKEHSAEELKLTVVVVYLLPIPHADRDEGDMEAFFLTTISPPFSGKISCNGGDIKAFFPSSC